MPGSDRLKNAFWTIQMLSLRNSQLRDLESES